jgi:hypothetical protein
MRYQQEQISAPNIRTEYPHQVSAPNIRNKYLESAAGYFVLLRSE